MKLSDFPFCVVLSREEDAERRANAFAQLEKLGVQAEWLKPVDETQVPWRPEFDHYKKNPKKLNHALSVLKMFEMAQERGHDTVWMVEDDVVFHPEIEERLDRMTLPAHWAMFYMGGHLFGGPYIDCGNGLWKVRHILHTHSVVFHKRVWKAVEAAMLSNLPDKIPDCDVRLARYCQFKFATYACHPNLAWQSHHVSTLDHSGIRKYNDQGQQMPMPYTADDKRFSL
jgi:hypothetical protein